MIKYHTEEREYSLPAGILSDNGIQEICNYLKTLGYASPALPKFDEWIADVFPMETWPDSDSGLFDIGMQLQDFFNLYYCFYPSLPRCARW